MSISDLIKRASRELTCPTCGRKFNLDEIKYRGSINHTILLQAVCANNHFPVVMIFIPPKAVADKLAPISSTDVRALEERLRRFRGNFNSLWGGKTRRDKK